MKKIMNQVDQIVIQMCQGIIDANPDTLSMIPRYKIIKRKQINKDKVILISGGGSGHEPAHAGFVGTGMLDAAVCGDVFASPSTVQVYNAIIATQGNKGTLLIIKNYSGDCMNFDSAAEMAETDDGIKIAKVYVNDDIAVKNSLYTVGRRGVAGTVFVHKIAGAAAEAGMELSEVKRIAEKVIMNVRTIGFALTSCTVPAKGTPTFCLDETEIEYGVGIHGEPGIARESLLSADDISKKLLNCLMAEFDMTENQPIALMINGLGATPLMELFVLNSEISSRIKKMGIFIHKTFVGNFMTSIDMAGASVTILRLDEELRGLLDAPSNTPTSFK